MATQKQVTGFIDMIAPIAQEKAKGRDRCSLPSVCIAQACCESAYGTSRKMVDANAVFGIKVGKSRVHFGKAWKDKAYSTQTKECYDGKTYVNITDMFRAYDSIEDAVEDYYDMLAGCSRYKGCLDQTDPRTCITAIKNGGYATDPGYVNTIMKIIDRYGLTRYDPVDGTGGTLAGKTEGGGRDMTEAQLRQKVVGIMQGWIGLKRSDKSHAPIIDTYNGHTPLPRGYKVTYQDAYCATTVSAAAIVAGFTDIMPVECSCHYLIEQAKKMGIWQENDAYVPDLGDEVLYDWQDSGIGDNTGEPDHVGMVVKVAGSTITVAEGNMSGGIVGYRNLQVNGRYIRGYIVPKYGSKADVKDFPNISGNLKVGDTVNFTGKMHYTSSYAGAMGRECMSGQAKVTAINKNGAHPYHLKAVSGKGSNVYGWVDAADIQGASSGPSGDTVIKVGDTVTYSGNVHYTSSYAGAKASICRGGTAKVTAVSRGNPHPYHLKHTGKGCTVYGWVDAEKVLRT